MIKVDDMLSYFESKEICYSSLNIKQKIKELRLTSTYLDDIEDKDIKDIHTDYTSIMILLKNGDLYTDGEIYKQDIKYLHHIDVFTVFAVNKQNQVFGICNANYNSRLTHYINNNETKYKKILPVIFMLICLTEEGDIKALLESPLGVGIIPENFSGVDNIIYDKKLDEVHIIKDNIEQPLFVYDKY